MARVPKGAGFSAYQRAVQEAAAEYRGVGRPVASNPPGGGLVKLGILGLAVYWVAKRFGGQTS